MYLAIPPSLFETVIEGLARVGLDEHGRVVLELPFGRDPASARELNRCVLDRFAEDAVFRIDQPGERVSVSVQIKQPGEELHSRPVDLVYDYDEGSDGPRDEAYARLLDSALDGDQRLFARADGVEEAWRIVAPTLGSQPPAIVYQPGSWGPEAADDLIAGDGGWHCPEVTTGA